MIALSQCNVVDATRAVDDQAMPTLRVALDPELAAIALREEPWAPRAPLREIRVLRHKPGRRCLVAYVFDDATEILGKCHARRYGKSGLRLLNAFWDAGFGNALDGISVPKPLGHVSKFQMWFQTRQAGTPMTDLLAPGTEVMMQHAAHAAHKIHTAGVQTEKTHTIHDEVQILRDRLTALGDARPQLRERLNAVIAMCERLAQQQGARAVTGIHRDYYPDQLLVRDAQHVCVIDFDLYCAGDPALDIGNFSGHLAEHALRSFGDMCAFSALEDALINSYTALAGVGHKPAIALYRALTLVRHIQLSTLHADRAHTTLPLLAHCEQLLVKLLA